MLPRALNAMLCLWGTPVALALAWSLAQPACAQSAAGQTKTAAGAKRAPAAAPQSKSAKPPPARSRARSGQPSARNSPAPAAKPPIILVRQATTQSDHAQGPQFVGHMSAQSAIVEAQARCKAENRRVLIVWGSDADRNSRAFVATLRSTADLQRILLYEYELVLADVGDRVDRNLDIAALYGAPLRQTGVPYLTLLDFDEPLVHVHAEYFNDGRGGYDAGKVLTFLRNFQPMAPRV
jgi:hypothetical protein